jgi:glycosidase
MGAMVQTVGGLPFIYYGEELGMTGRRYQNDDISRRDAFPWGGWAPAGAASAADTNWQKASSRLEPGSNRATPAVAAQDADASSPLNLYRRLAELRRTHPTLHASTTGAVAWPGFNQGAVVSWTRGAGAGQLLVVHNLGDSDQGLSLPAGVVGRLVFDSGAVLPGGFRAPEPAASASTPAGGQIAIPAVSTRVWELLVP